jgi:hypothetical protein
LEVVAMAQNVVCFSLCLFICKTNSIKFKERYERMYSGSNATAPHPTSGTQDSDYDMSDDDDSGDLTKPWLAEYQRYITTHDVLLEGTSLVEWWGVSLESSVEVFN